MTVLNLGIIASADDAYQTPAGTVDINDAFTDVIDATTEYIGWRFQNVTIPQGATINSAILSLMPTGSTVDEPEHTFFGEDVDNAALFVAGAGTFTISSRAMTAASVLWSNANLGADGATYFNVPDIAALIQEVVNRAGWVSGNSIVIICQGGATSTRDLAVFMWDNDGTGATAAKLVIDHGAATITITPNPVAIPILTAAPIVTVHRLVSPTPVTVPIVVPSPTISIIQAITPSPVAILIVIPAPAILVITVQAYQGLTRLLNPTDWGGTPTLILEIHAFTSSAGSPIKAHLYNVTDSAVVSGSQISSANTVLDRLRSSAFSLVAGSKEYEVRYGGVSGATYTMEDAVLIVSP